MAKILKLYLASFFLIICCLCTTCAGVRQVASDKEKKIEIESAFFEVDNLNNIYVVSKQNELSKWNNQGELLYKFSDNRLGNISILDTSNPLQTLAYYPDFRWLRFFDRTLNMTHELSLLEAGFLNVNALCSSNDNNIWFFDEINQVLMKIDQEAKVLIRSDDLRQALNKSIFPTLLLERKNKLLLYDGASIYAFDAFGTFLNEVKIGQARSMVFNGRSCNFLDNQNKYIRVDVLSKTALLEQQRDFELGILDYKKGLDCQFYRRKRYILIKNGFE